MKNLYLKSIALATLFTVVISLTGCKDKNEDPEPTPPVVEITSPQGGTMFSNGDTVMITGTITHTEELHEYLITLTDLHHDEIVFSEGEHSHGNSINFSAYWVNDVMHHSDMLLEVTAVDHDGLTTAKTVNFHCHP